MVKDTKSQDGSGRIFLRKRRLKNFPCARPEKRKSVKAASPLGQVILGNNLWKSRGLDWPTVFPIGSLKDTRPSSSHRSVKCKMNFCIRCWKVGSTMSSID